MSPSVTRETLTAAELDQCRSYLKETGNAALRTMTNLSPAQWEFKTDPERWSIAEILEHMVVIQELVLGPIRQQLAAAPMAGHRDCELVDAIVINRFPDRSVKLQAPEPGRPTGRFTPDAALERFLVNCGRLREYVETNPDLRMRTIDAAPLKAISQGEHTQMDGYQWVLAVSAHTERHTKQVLEVQADVRYPG